MKDGDWFVLAQQALALLVFDLGYGPEHWPRNGHAPIRHQLMWAYCKTACGEQFDSMVESMAHMRADDE